MNDAWRLTAVQLADAIARGDLSAVEAVNATLKRIDDLDGKLNAFISVDPEAALREARNRDRVPRERRGPLHGVPVAVKDVTDVAGFPTTHGSLAGDPQPATRDEESVARLRAAGAIIVGKTNTPEYGFGAVCTNKVTGPTSNPWNLDLTSGGSSGGSAVAVTAGMVPLAQGTDFGGSVRTPASFCGCVGLRPTPGLIPEPRRPLAHGPLATQGILARTIDDAALMLAAMAGPHPHDPASYRRPCDDDRERPLRVASTLDLGGAFPVDEAVKIAFTRSVDAAQATFGPIADKAPPMTGAAEAFKVLRAAETWNSLKTLVQEREADLTESLVWNAKRGSEITADQYLSAQRARTQIYRNAMSFFSDFDILMLPAASVLPFPISQGEVEEVGDRPTESILDYLTCTFLISLIGFPAMSLPAVWTDDGLPFGVQLVARPDNEAVLLRAASELVRGSGYGHRWP